MSAHVFGKQVIDVRKAVVDQAVDDGKEGVRRMAPKDNRFFGNRGAVLNQDISVGLALCKKSAAASTLRKEAAGRYGGKKKLTTSSTSTPASNASRAMVPTLRSSTNTISTSTNAASSHAEKKRDFQKKKDYKKGK